MTSQSHSSSRASHVERVEPCCSTSSTQPKFMSSTCRTCRVEKRHDEPSGMWAMLYDLAWQIGQELLGVEFNCEIIS